MERIKRVLITGHNGYLGSVMAPEFMREGYDVVGLDTEYFGECSLVSDTIKIPSIRKDIRDVDTTDLIDFDAIVHLAALSNDPIGNLNAGWTEQINLQGSIRLAELAKKAGVRRFLFSSSCIMYGMSETAVVNEDSPLDPKTEYAHSKVAGERAISELADDDFSPVFLRNGTVYGLSPRMRFDTVLNDLVGSAVTTGKVTLCSNGQPWRPVIHIRDVASAFMAVLKAPQSDIHNQAFNTGANHLNRQIIDLAKIVVATVDGCKLEILSQSNADQRTYKADFTKFSKTFPDFEFKWTPQRGARALYESLKKYGLSHTDFVDKKFTRLKWLNHLLDTGRLNNVLRWTNG